MSEGYRNIKPSEVPRGVEFSEGVRVGQFLVSFSKGATPSEWGAEYRCLVHCANGKVQFARYWHEPDGRNVVGDDFIETEPHE